MTIHFNLIPILAIAAGTVILLKPRYLNYAVALFLISYGVLSLLGIR
jgi:multisubunit Na+/H+ antiporter MnhC subunit